MTIKMAGRVTEELRSLDTAHHLHPFTDHKTFHASGGARIITRAEGMRLWDSDGNIILDAMSGLWCVNVGYGRKDLAEAAHRQMLELSYYNTFFKTSTVPAIALADTIARLMPDNINRVFFVNSGSEANDTIVRLVRHYHALRGEPERDTFIARRNAYHGSTMATASLGGMAAMHAQGGLPLPGFVHVDHPYWYGEGGNLSPEAFGVQAAQAVEKKILELGPERVAAFIGEPVQGAGGVVIPPDSYWPEINRICEQYGVLLICDEVICGFGRTGNWFGFETYGIRPDIVAMAKGLSSGYLPIGAVAVADSVIDFIIQNGGEFFHGYTYSGHPVACAVAQENIRIIEREGLVERVRDMAPYLGAALGTLADHPLVGEVRSVGFLGACELVRDKRARTRYQPLGRVGLVCRDRCFDVGLVMRSCGDTMVVAPPFIATQDDIDEIVRLARIALDRTLGDVAGELEHEEERG